MVVDMMSAQVRMLGPAQVYLHLIDGVLTGAQGHRYEFVIEEIYQSLLKSDSWSIQLNNTLLAKEVLDRAHLAAITSLIRNKRWAEAVCDAYRCENYLSWAGATRALLESAGDALYSLGPIAITLAEIHHDISACLRGKAKKDLYGFSKMEHLLDHFVIASWQRRSKDLNPVYRAKDNIEYVKELTTHIPDVETLYHRLCAIVHPAGASIDWTFEHLEDGTFKVKTDDLSAIEEIVKQWPDAIPAALNVSCNAALLVLWVLDEFDMHPRLSILKDYHWSEIGLWRRIEAALHPSSKSTMRKAGHQRSRLSRTARRGRSSPTKS